MPVHKINGRCPRGNTQLSPKSSTCLKKCSNGFSRKKGSFVCTKKQVRSPRGSPKRSGKRASPKKGKRAKPKKVPLIHELD